MASKQRSNLSVYTAPLQSALRVACTGRLPQTSGGKALFILLSASTLFPGVTHAAVPQGAKCHVLIKGSCMSLEGLWKVKEGKPLHDDDVRKVSRTLKIDEVPRESHQPMMFEFGLEVFRARGAYTGIGGQFEIKDHVGAVGVYSGPSDSAKGKMCTLVFLPISASKLAVTSFGLCEQGHQTSPDGIYFKVQAPTLKPSNPPFEKGRAKSVAPFK
jgi:hypothetical protein